MGCFSNTRNLSQYRPSNTKAIHSESCEITKSKYTVPLGKTGQQTDKDLRSLSPSANITLGPGSRILDSSIPQESRWRLFRRPDCPRVPRPPENETVGGGFAPALVGFAVYSWDGLAGCQTTAPGIILAAGIRLISAECLAWVLAVWG